jgi:hypothetical protein
MMSSLQIAARQRSRPGTAGRLHLALVVATALCRRVRSESASGALIVLPLLLLTSATLHATPLITAQPSGQTAFVGDADVYLQVRETGATSYQWQVKTGGTGTAVNVSGTRYKNAATPLLRIMTPDATLDGNTYGCVISDGSGSVTTAFAPLKVFAAPTATAPVVTLGKFHDLREQHRGHFSPNHRARNRTIRADRAGARSER